MSRRGKLLFVSTTLALLLVLVPLLGALFTPETGSTGMEDPSGWLAAGSSDVAQPEAAAAALPDSPLPQKLPAAEPAALLIAVEAPLAAPVPPPAQPRSDAALAGSGKAAPTAAAGTPALSYYAKVQRRLAAGAGELPAGVRGEARLRFTVLADGSVTGAQVVRSSGHAALDSAALALLAKTSPLPAPSHGELVLEVPIRAE